MISNVRGVGFGPSWDSSSAISSCESALAITNYPSVTRNTLDGEFHP